MGRVIHPRLTPARRRHLEQLSDGEARRVAQRGPAGFACRKLGWCAFAVRIIATGQIVPSPDRWYDDDGVRLVELLTDPWDGAEIITPEGRRVLEAATASGRRAPA